MDPFDNRFEKDLVAARKVQKAGREKLRREKLNEQFLELGNALDPEQHKNDKVTILRDTIQMLKDLTAKINTLKAEYNSLSEESHELTQEKNELREEKANLKSAVDHLSVQCQQRLAVVHPWAICDSSLILHPPYPVPIPSAPILIHSDVVPSGTRKRPQLKDIPSSSSSSRCSSCSVAVDNSSVVGDGPVSENK
ncbi:transcription factor bHLH121-like isoform X3 [Zingiber officinale]|uniref:transcription factor bHLH121-like isoform X3 n=1 Tax=Zingiber officinale TaxID=94328 RepID=UPI001C4CE708|nr:transcription factor bHLH121-like isoform X3 [Zingiber officinale]